MNPVSSNSSLAMYVASAFLLLFLLRIMGKWLLFKWERHAKAKLERKTRKQEAATLLAKRMANNAAKRQRAEVEREKKAAKKANKLALKTSAAEEAKQVAGDGGASVQGNGKEILRTKPQSVGEDGPATPTTLRAKVDRPHPDARAELALLERQLEESAIKAATILQESNKARQETQKAHAKALKNQENRHKEEMERERKASKKAEASLKQELEAVALMSRQEKDKESKARLQLEERLREAQMQAGAAKSQAAEAMAEALQQRKARHIAEAKAAQKPKKPDEELVQALGQALATIEDLRRSVDNPRREANMVQQEVEEERLRRADSEPWSQRLASLQVSDLAGGELERVQVVSAELQRQCTREQLRREMDAERERAQESRQCVICLEREVNLAFECGHQVCDACGEGLKQCHICRKKVGRRIKLFRN